MQVIVKAPKPPAPNKCAGAQLLAQTRLNSLVGYVKKGVTYDVQFRERCVHFQDLCQRHCTLVLDPILCSGRFLTGGGSKFFH